MAAIRKREKKWQARVRRKGHPDQVKSFTNKADAVRWSREAESAMDQGVFISRASAEQTTLAKILTRYKTEVTPSHRGFLVEGIRINKLITHRIAGYALTALNAQRMAAYRDERLTQVTPGTVLRELQTLSAVLNHAQREWGLKIENPVRGIRKPPPNQARSRQLEAGEEQRLLEALEPTERGAGGYFRGTRNAWIKPLVLLALETAMRRGELLSLQWANLSLNRQIALLPITKNGTARVVPLSTKAVELLQALPRPLDGRVFPISANALKLAFTRAVERAELENFHFHDLRHEATRRLAEKLPNLIELAAVTGHRDLRMLHRYYHPHPEDLARKLG